MRLLTFDDPQLDGRYEWLMEDDGNVHVTMRALARQAYRRNQRHVPDVGLDDQLRAHGTVDARPYVPPAASPPGP